MEKIGTVERRPKSEKIVMRTYLLSGSLVMMAKTNPAMMFSIPRQITIRGSRSLELGKKVNTIQAAKHVATTSNAESAFAVLKLRFILPHCNERRHSASGGK